MGAAIKAMLADYRENNKQKDPFKNLEFVALPLLMAITSYVLRVVTDVFCRGTPNTPEFDFEFLDVCTRTSDILSNVYIATFTALAMVSIATGHGAWSRIAEVLRALGVNLPMIGGQGQRD